MIAKASKEESMHSNSGVAMQILANEEFDNELGKGIYTHRVIHLAKYA